MSEKTSLDLEKEITELTQAKKVRREISTLIDQSWKSEMTTTVTTSVPNEQKKLSRQEMEKREKAFFDDMNINKTEPKKKISIANSLSDIIPDDPYFIHRPLTELLSGVLKSKSKSTPEIHREIMSSLSKKTNSVKNGTESSKKRNRVAFESMPKEISEFFKNDDCQDLFGLSSPEKYKIFQELVSNEVAREKMYREKARDASRVSSSVRPRDQEQFTKLEECNKRYPHPCSLSLSLSPCIHQPSSLDTYRNFSASQLQ